MVFIRGVGSATSTRQETSHLAFAERKGDGQLHHSYKVSRCLMDLVRVQPRTFFPGWHCCSDFTRRPQ